MTQLSATFANKLLEQACKQKASDIHFHPIPGKEKIEIYFRILGQRTYIRSIDKDLYRILLVYFKYSANMDIAETRKPQDGMIDFQNTDKKCFSLRLSTLPLTNNESLTIRILPQAETPILEQLFLFPSQFKKMKQWLNQRAGMILLTGPTGSGKTTTMYALLESMLHEQSCQAITLEDPIERKIDKIIQVEVNEKAGVSYQAGLKAALRHDPDVLMIGEIRDQETAQFAFRAALTGHLVLSTLHAKDATSTIDRLVDLGITRADINQSLIAVAAIQLLPIERKNKLKTRAAIVELLDGRLLEEIVQGDKIMQPSQYHSFYHLREKAFLYGFISKEVFENTR